MAYIPVPNTVRLCLQGVWAGQLVELCLGWRKDTAVTVSDLEDLTDGMETWRVAEFIPHVNHLYQMTQWVATALATATSPSVITPITADDVGLDAGPSVSNNSTMTTTFLTDLRGRSYRGRVYTPGLNQSDQLTSTDMSGTLAAALTAAYALMNTYVPVAFSHAVISLQTAGAPRATGVATPVTGYRSNTQIDSQRRRLAGRGV